MSQLFMYLALVALLSFAASPVAFAHVPLTSGGNEDIESATYISDPTKSWAIYAELHEGGEAQYYRLDMTEGQRLFVTLLTPPDGEFTPGMAIMGTGLEDHEYTHEEDEAHEHEVPDFIAVPEGAEVMVVTVHRDQVLYEPFGPGSYYFLAEVDLEVPATGTYYIVVYDPSMGGKYSLAPGYLEVWTLDEWILAPIGVIGTHQWEGQPLGFILAPMFATMAIGLGLLVWRYKGAQTPKTLYGWVGGTAGLLCLGSGVIVLTQMVIALTRVTVMPEPGWLAVTVAFALMPISLGIGALLLTVKSQEKVSSRKKIYLFIIGLLALFAWAGLLAGPALAMLASVIPSRTR